MWRNFHSVVFRGTKICLFVSAIRMVDCQSSGTYVETKSSKTVPENGDWGMIYKPEVEGNDSCTRTWETRSREVYNGTKWTQGQMVIIKISTTRFRGEKVISKSLVTCAGHFRGEFQLPLKKRKPSEESGDVNRMCVERQRRINVVFDSWLLNYNHWQTYGLLSFVF